MKRAIPSLMVARFGFGYDANAQALFTAAQITSETVKNAVNNLIIDFKASGFWAACGAIYGMAGDGISQTYESQYKYNWKNPLDTDAAFRLTYFNSPTCDANGIAFNGSNQYLDTHIIPGTDLLLNDAHSSYYSRTNVVGGIDIGSYEGAGAQAFYLGIRRASDASNSAIYNETGGQLAQSTVSDSRGLFMNSRASLTSHDIYQNGSSYASNTTANTGTRPTTSSIFIGALNLGGPVLNSNKQCAFASFGAGIGSSLAASTYTSIQNYETALSRNV